MTVLVTILVLSVFDTNAVSIGSLDTFTAVVVDELWNIIVNGSESTWKNYLRYVVIWIHQQFPLRIVLYEEFVFYQEVFKVDWFHQLWFALELSKWVFISFGVEIVCKVGY